MRFSKWKPTRNIYILASILALAARPNQFQETAISDTIVVEPRITEEKKKHLQVVNVLKESVGATMIFKDILDLGLNLTIDKSLALSPAIKK